VPVAGTGEFLPVGVLRHIMATPDTRNLRISSPPTRGADPPEPAEEDQAVGKDDQNMAVDLGRLAWSGTVLVCLIVVVILVLQGYYGYAAVTFAVALAAAINLL
jgi:hypothetical protein